jgi:hypothetical protein
MLAPLPSKQWDPAKAAHLLNRAGFGGTPEAIDSLHRLGLEGAVESLLDGPDESAKFPPPDYGPMLSPMMVREMFGEMSVEERQMKLREAQKDARERGLELLGLWIRRMRDTAFPLREKLALFWHGHFATSVEKVKDPYLMWVQNETFRKNALGSFAALTKAVARDPAMMIYLDTRESRRLQPNENFARELMELFTLGIGHYTENDIREAARAFTGYKLNPVDMTYRFASVQQDDGEKVFFGKRGKFNGDDIVDLILAQPRCGVFIAGQLWRFFVEDAAAETEVQDLGARFAKGGYEVRPLMREIFRSAVFYGPRAVRTQIKSPVQFAVNLSKILETPLPPGPQLANLLRQLGQLPFMPPSVKGWDGGKAWITTASLLARYNAANYAIGSGPMPMARGGRNAAGPVREVFNRSRVDFAKLAPPDLRGDRKELLAALEWRVFNAKLPPAELEPFEDYLRNLGREPDDAAIREVLHLMMSTPQFQLT